MKIPLKKKWLLAEESRFALVNNVPIHYSKSYGGKDEKGNEITGFGLDSSFELARLKSKAELIERLALINSKGIPNSNGMAAHTDFELAVKNASLELYERHCMLRVWISKLVTPFYDIPDLKYAKVAKALCRVSNTEIIVKDISDPKYQIPCVMAVVYSKQHGGILTSSSAGITEVEAIEKALMEIIKGLFYRVVIKNQPIFLNDSTQDKITSPNDHEYWFARTNISKKSTAFLVESYSQKKITEDVGDLGSLKNKIAIEDLTNKCPEPYYWYVVRASSPHLLLLEFGEPSESFWRRVHQVLDDSTEINKMIHPIG